MKSDLPDSYHCPLRHQAIIASGKIAIRLKDQELSFGQLDAMVENCRDTYQARGLKREDRLAVMVVSPLDTIVLAFACLRAGWVFSPVNPAFPDQQIKAYCQRIEASLVTSSAGIDAGIDAYIEGCDQTLPEKCEKTTPSAPVPLAENDTFSLIATSGTTGTPKAVAHCYRNHYFSALGSLATLPLEPGDGWFLSLPLFHVGGFSIVMRCVLSGATMVLYPKETPLHDILEKEGISHLSLVNTQLFRLLEQGVDLYRQGVRYILLGGGLASPKLVEKVQKQGVRVLITYGMTEMASQVCTGSPDFTEQGITSGGVLPYRHVMIDGQGEILVRGETLAQGYYDRGRLISLRDQQGWYHSGDQGRWLNGQVLVSGRRDHMMISGGENIHPEEVEQALLTLPEVVQAVVVAVNDQEFGQRPEAYVQTFDGTLDEEYTKSQLRCMIAGFKIPRRIHLFPADVRQMGIKIDRGFFQALSNGVTVNR